MNKIKQNLKNIFIIIWLSTLTVYTIFKLPNNTLFNSIKGQSPGLLIFTLSGTCPPSMNPVPNVLNNRLIMISKETPSISNEPSLVNQSSCKDLSGSFLFGNSLDDSLKRELGCENEDGGFRIGGTNNLHHFQTPLSKHKHSSRFRRYAFRASIHNNWQFSVRYRSEAQHQAEIGTDDPNDPSYIETLETHDYGNINYYPKYVRLKACVWGR